MFRRRPLLRGAMVAGAGYAVGKRQQRSRQQQDDQEERIEDLEAQQAAPAAPAPAAAGGGIDDATIESLTKLGQLHDSGVLTDAEFEEQKRRLLGM